MKVDKINIFIKNKPKQYNFKSRGFGSLKIPNRDHKKHGVYLKSQLIDYYNDPQSTIVENEGFYVDFIGKKSFDLVTKSLENRTNGIMLLNSCVVDCTEKATVFIPYDKKEFFIKKIDEYIVIKNYQKRVSQRIII